MIRQVRGPSMKRAGFHQANQISSEVQDMKSDLRKVQSSIDESQSVLQELVHHIGSQITPKTSNASNASTMLDITT